MSNRLPPNCLQRGYDRLDIQAPTNCGIPMDDLTRLLLRPNTPISHCGGFFLCYELSITHHRNTYSSLSKLPWRGVATFSKSNRKAAVVRAKNDALPIGQAERHQVLQMETMVPMSCIHYPSLSLSPATFSPPRPHFATCRNPYLDYFILVASNLPRNFSAGTVSAQGGDTWRNSQRRVHT